MNKDHILSSGAWLTGDNGISNVADVRDLFASCLSPIFLPRFVRPSEGRSPCFCVLRSAHGQELASALMPTTWLLLDFGAADFRLGRNLSLRMG